MVAGQLPDKGLPPQYQLQWLDMPGHPEGAVEPCPNSLKGQLPCCS